MSIADFYDALISPRVYKAPFTHADTVAMIRDQRGRHFDPDMVDAFLAIQEEFNAIALRYPDDGMVEAAGIEPASTSHPQSGLHA